MLSMTQGPPWLAKSRPGCSHNGRRRMILRTNPCGGTGRVSAKPCMHHGQGCGSHSEGHQNGPMPRVRDWAAIHCRYEYQCQQQNEKLTDHRSHRRQNGRRASASASSALASASRSISTCVVAVAALSRSVAASAWAASFAACSASPGFVRARANRAICLVGLRW